MEKGENEGWLGQPHQILPAQNGTYPTGKSIWCAGGLCGAVELKFWCSGQCTKILPRCYAAYKAVA